MKFFFKKGEPKNIREKLTAFFKYQKINMTNEQMQMIHGAVELIRLEAKNVKISVADIISISFEASQKEILLLVKKSGHSRIPVHKDHNGIKTFVGILYTKDLLKNLIKKSSKTKISDLMRPPYMVPESQSLLSLLREMRLQKQHLALTVNEYGDVTGLVTLEDIIEEIVGEIHDEFDKEKVSIQKIKKHSYQVPASITLADLNQELMLNLPEEQFQTLAGFLLHELNGELEEKAEVHYGNVRLILKEFQEHHIKSVIISIEKKLPINSKLNLSELR